MTLGVFKEIEHLIEYIPVNSQENDGHDARLETGTSIDSRFAFIDVGGVSIRLGIIEPEPGGVTLVSLRDIVRLLNKFLKDASIEELTPRHNNYDGLLETGPKITAQIRSILFDYCLAALDGNNFDARLYLVHLLHFAGLRKRLNLLLAILVNNRTFTQDTDVRQLLTLLARIAEPDNIDKYFDAQNGGFNIRYVTYLREMERLSTVRAMSIATSAQRKPDDNKRG